MTLGVSYTQPNKTLPLCRVLRYICSYAQCHYAECHGALQTAKNLKIDNLTFELSSSPPVACTIGIFTSVIYAVKYFIQGKLN
jgi:hypothetical protein